MINCKIHIDLFGNYTGTTNLEVNEEVSKFVNGGRTPNLSDAYEILCRVNEGFTHKLSKKKVMKKGTSINVLHV
jgi:hypothetical protein